MAAHDLSFSSLSLEESREQQGRRRVALLLGATDYVHPSDSRSNLLERVKNTVHTFEEVL